MSKARQSSMSETDAFHVVRSLSIVMRSAAVSDEQSIYLHFLSDELDVELTSRVLRKLCRHLVGSKQILVDLRQVLLDCSLETHPYVAFGIHADAITWSSESTAWRRRQ